MRRRGLPRALLAAWLVLALAWLLPLPFAAVRSVSPVSPSQELYSVASGPRYALGQGGNGYVQQVDLEVFNDSQRVSYVQNNHRFFVYRRGTGEMVTDYARQSIPTVSPTRPLLEIPPGGRFKTQEAFALQGLAPGWYSLTFLPTAIQGGKAYLHPAVGLEVLYPGDTLSWLLSRGWLTACAFVLVVVTGFLLPMEAVGRRLAKMGRSSGG